MIQFAWRFLQHQPDSLLAQWFRQRTQDGRRNTRKTMIVALARKLLIMLWRLATTGEVPAGIRLHAGRSEETEPARELNRFGARAVGGRNCR
jgi:transposase